ncbi:MAG TPA: ABC transporter ATP-binding protein [Gemmatimonadaceae bacterium]
MSALRDLFAPVRSRVAGAITLMACVALSEATGLFVLLPLLQRTGLVSGRGAYPAPVERIFSALPARLMPMLALFVLAAFVRSACQFAEAGVVAAIEARIVETFRVQVFGVLARARWDVLARQHGARITQVLTVELSHAGAAATMALRSVFELFVALVYVAASFVISPALTVASIASAVLLLLIVMPFRAASRADGEALGRLEQGLFVGATEDIVALKAAKASGLADAAALDFGRHASAYAHAWARAQRRGQQLQALLGAGAALSLAIITYVAITVRGDSGPALIALMLVYGRLVPKLISLQSAVVMTNRYLPAVERIQELIVQLESSPEADSVGTELPVRKGSLRLDHVTYRYPDALTDAVNDVSLTIPAGAVTALVGPSGAGKTTIADIILMLLAPTSGTLSVDGAPLTVAHRSSWRRSAAYVAQDTLLRHRTLRENIAWGLNVSDKEVLESLGRAGANKLLATLPDGLDTVLGDRGVRLSGGERQRIAIARALLRRPKMVVLDEATSALDLESEAEIRASIAALTPAVTVLLITHRVTSLGDEDHVVVLGGGRVVAEGRREALRRTLVLP